MEVDLYQAAHEPIEEIIAKMVPKEECEIELCLCHRKKTKHRNR